MADSLLVRIRPYNPKAGQRVQTYTYKGMRFREEAGWYKVDKEIAEELRELSQDETDPLAMPVFDVLSEEQAAQVEERERLRKERASALRPNSQPNLRANDPRRALTMGQRDPSPVGVFPAPNDEVIPNGYPPPRNYPMPQPSGGQTAINATVNTVLSEEVPESAYQEAARAGVDDRTLSVSAANIQRDQQGISPIVVDGQGTDEDGTNFNVEEGDTDFGPDSDSGEEGESGEEGDEPASPPVSRRRRRA